MIRTREYTNNDALLSDLVHARKMLKEDGELLKVTETVARARVRGEMIGRLDEQITRLQMLIGM